MGALRPNTALQLTRAANYFKWFSREKFSSFYQFNPMHAQLS